MPLCAPPRRLARTLRRSRVVRDAWGVRGWARRQHAVRHTRHDGETHSVVTTSISHNTYPPPPCRPPSTPAVSERTPHTSSTSKAGCTSVGRRAQPTARAGPASQSWNAPISFLCQRQQPPHANRTAAPYLEAWHQHHRPRPCDPGAATVPHTRRLGRARSALCGLITVVHIPRAEI